MAGLVDEGVKRSGMVALFVSWQRAAFESQHQAVLRDEATKRYDEAMAAVNACREGCKAFGVDVNNEAQMKEAIEAYAREAAQVYNQTRPAHLPFWQYLPIEPESTQAEQISPPPLENPPPPPMPKIKDILVSYLEVAHDLELGGARAADMRQHIETRYSTSIHEKTVGMTLYRLLKDGKVRRKGHLWFFVPQSAETKNPGVSAPGSSE